MKGEEGLLGKVSLLCILTLVFLETPLKHPGHNIGETRKTSEHITGYLCAENTG